MTNESCERGTEVPRIHEKEDIEPARQEQSARDASCPSADASCPSAIAAASGRRTLLAAGIGLGFGLVAGPLGAQSDPTHDRPKEGDLLVKADDATPTPLTPDSIPLGAEQVMAWPMDPVGSVVRDGSRLNKVLLLRLDPAVLNGQTAQHAAEGVVAYSAICPHTGCEVVSWFADRQILECPCHNSEYDPKAGAKVISGPSPRSLAALPLRIVDGKLTVAQPFIGRLGIQQV